MLTPATKARVITTTRCNRNCDGCCNTGPVFDEHDMLPASGAVDYLTNGQWREVMITGGEPMLEPEFVLDFARRLRNAQRDLVIYLYSAFYQNQDYRIWDELGYVLDGIQFTLHAECTDRDVMALHDLARLMSKSRGSNRLSIDSRLYDRYDFSNMDLSGFGVVRKLVWQQDCPLPDSEHLFILDREK